MCATEGVSISCTAGGAMGRATHVDRDLGDELSAWVAAAELARTGNEVLLQQSTPSESSHRAEPGLMESLATGMAAGRIRLCHHQEAVQAPWHWLASHPADISQAETLCHQLRRQGPDNLVLINQSNFGIGASDRLHALLDHARQQSLVCLPDTLQQGQALQQFATPETLLVGCEETDARLRLRALLRPFSLRLQQIQWMSRREAEFSKFAISGMLALRLGYINELANLADRLGVDIEVGAPGDEQRQADRPPLPGPGLWFWWSPLHPVHRGAGRYTGRSSPLDPAQHGAERKRAPERAAISQTLAALPLRSARAAHRHLGLCLQAGGGQRRQRPLLRVIRALLAQGAQVQVHDPEALPALQNALGRVAGLSLHQDPYHAARETDALLLLTEWPQYSSPDYARLLRSMQTPLIVDRPQPVRTGLPAPAGLHLLRRGALSRPPGRSGRQPVAVLF